MSFEKVCQNKIAIIHDVKLECKKIWNNVKKLLKKQNKNKWVKKRKIQHKNPKDWTLLIVGNEWKFEDSLKKLVIKIKRKKRGIYGAWKFETIWKIEFKKIWKSKKKLDVMSEKFVSNEYF